MKSVFAILLLGCSATSSSNNPSMAIASSECGALKPVAIRELIGQWKSENHKFAFTRTLGAEVIVPASPSLSREWVERAAHCRLQHPDVALTAATVRVISIDSGYAVQLTSDDPTLAKAILERAPRL